MTSSTNCPKCAGEMEEGFVLDQSQGRNLQSAWIEGPPSPSFWTGLKMRGRERLPVTTMRCVKCGFLESYAEPT
jgi:hypothetical protein